ncbi:hypothetical protein GobsT_53000 [Gemmata obscuriglobus]|nr:hypothetical protein GobsT_53000 [Gemmata obscuriglobus]VTS09819.1 unnamed protein product [Gemmata obscuriglobus UQM 2246]
MNRIPISSPRTTRAPAVGWLRALLPASEWDTRSDAELLDRFVRYTVLPAFEALLRRHGPLVWGVYRLGLAHAPDVDNTLAGKCKRLRSV